MSVLQCHYSSESYSDQNLRGSDVHHQPVIDVCRVVDGRIVEHWGVPDRFAVLAQTGLLDRLAA